MQIEGKRQVEEIQVGEIRFISLRKTGLNISTFRELQKV